jgi:hypothetical protein
VCVEPIKGSKIVTISVYEASVGVFVPYLGNLPHCSIASAYAATRNIDPAVLLGMRHYPNMYSRAAVLLSRHDRLRHPASRRR